MIARLYTLLTGWPWTTTRSCTSEYGPPPGAVHQRALADYSDLELLKFGDEIIHRLREENR